MDRCTFTDWGSRSYPLHGEGKVWHIKASPPLSDQQVDANGIGQRFSRGDLQKSDALAQADWEGKGIPRATEIALSEHASDELRTQAVRILGKHRQDVRRFAAVSMPRGVRAAAMESLTTADANLIVDAPRIGRSRSAGGGGSGAGSQSTWIRR